MSESFLKNNKETPLYSPINVVNYVNSGAPSNQNMTNNRANSKIEDNKKEEESQNYILMTNNKIQSTTTINNVDLKDISRQSTQKAKEKESHNTSVTSATKKGYNDRVSSSRQDPLNQDCLVAVFQDEKERLDTCLEVKNTIKFRNENNKDHINKNSDLNENDLSKEKQQQIYHSNFAINDDQEVDKDDYIIQIRNVHKSYLIGVEGVPALRGVSLKIKTGEFVIILGTSGGGKTTLLNVLGTIDSPTRGDLRIYDSSIKSNSDDSLLSFIRLKEIAFVFQSFNLLSNMNVVENVELPMKILGELSSTEIRERSLSLLESVGLSKRLWHFPNQLSGGEQQRVTIARALANNPKILLLDEPTGDLDTKNSDIVMDILMKLNVNKKITMVMVTHDVGLKTYGNRIVRMMDGKIQAITDTNPNERKEAILKLEERVAHKDFKLREGAEGVLEADKSHTYTRKISDYKIISQRFIKDNIKN